MQTILIETITPDELERALRELYQSKAIWATARHPGLRARALRAVEARIKELERWVDR